MAKIDFTDISVVVQGYIGAGNNEQTKQCINSIKKFLPGSRIILSTYFGSNIDGLKYDEAYFSENIPSVFTNIVNKEVYEKIPIGVKSLPKYGLCRWYEFENVVYPLVEGNLNGLITTTKNGLSLVKTPYALKIRNDMVLSGNTFIKYFLKPYKRVSEYKLFKQRIVSGSYFARLFFDRWLGYAPMAFHMSDWIQFGNTEDIKKLYDIPLMPISDFTYFFSHEKTNYRKNKATSERYHNEPYILYSCFKKEFGDIHFDDQTAYTEEIIDISIKTLINNFVFLNPDDFGFDLKKYPRMYTLKGSMSFGFITTFCWKQLYKMICKDNIPNIPNIYSPIKDFFIDGYRTYRYYKPQVKLRAPLKTAKVFFRFSDAILRYFYRIFTIPSKSLKKTRMIKKLLK